MKHRQAAVTPAAGRRRRVALPTASRPHMPGYGVPASAAGLLPWDWAERRLTRSHNYWLITVRPDGRPHAMPVWGVWVDGAFYFNGGRESRKVRNLATNRRCIVCGERADEAVIVEGVALRVRGQKALARVTRPYQAKYRPWKLDPAMPVYAVRPRTVFGLPERHFPDATTRWRF